MSEDTITETTDAGAEVGGMPAGGLYGSSLQPAVVMIGGKEEALGVAVGAAFAKSGLTGNAWNALPDEEREKLIGVEIDRAAPTRAELDGALAALPGDNTDADYVVRGMRSYFGGLFTDDDEKTVREVVKTAEERLALLAASQKKGKRNVRRQVTTNVVDAATTGTVKKTNVVDSDEAELPARVTLAAPYAFYDDENVLHSWLAGSVVEDPAEIAVLVDRGAVFEAE